MRKEDFQSLRGRIERMMTDVPDWRVRPSSIIEDYIKINSRYGFGLVLSDLVKPAYEIVQKGFETVGRDADIGDMAGILSFRDGESRRYKYSAYYFAVALMAVSLGKKDISEIDVEGIDENELLAYDATALTSEEKDPIRSRLKKFGVRLLDFSRRNNKLVHFEPSRDSGIAFYSSDPYATMRALAGRERISLASWDKVGAKTILKCSSCHRYAFAAYDFSAREQHAEACEVCDGKKRTKSMVPLKERLILAKGDKIECRHCGTKLNINKIPSDFICPTCKKPIKFQTFPVVGESALKKIPANEVISSASDSEARATAKALMNKAAAFSKNFGMHVLYAACGFLKWRDKIGVEYVSPLLLCPIYIGIDKTSGDVWFENRSGGACFEVNKTLYYMLASYSEDCSIVLPEIASVTNPRSYFNLVTGALRASNRHISRITADWEISETFGIGLFRYRKIQLHDDLEKNFDAYLRNPIIGRLCGDMSRTVPDVPRADETLEYTVLDADSSQEEVILAARRGRSFILQGPPGSGKSQTITNIITTALGDGKTVLFVTEKATARAVIKENLSRLRVDAEHSLTDFVLDFDALPRRSGAVCREPFVEEMNSHLQIVSGLGGISGQLAAEERYTKSRISVFMEETKEEHEGISYLGLIRDAAEYSQYRDPVTADKIPKDPIDFAELCDTLKKYYLCVEAGAVKADYRTDVLYGCRGDRTGKLAYLSEKYLRSEERIKSAVNGLAELGLKIRLKRRSVEYALELLSLWENMPELTDELILGIEAGELENLISVCKKKRAAAHALENHAGRAVESRLKQGNYSRQLQKRLSDEALRYSSVLKRIGSDYGKFKKSVFGCFVGDNGKGTYKNALVCLNELGKYSDYLALAETCRAEEAENVRLFGASPKNEGEWAELADGLSKIKDVLVATRKEVPNAEKCDGWLRGFTRSEREERLEEIRYLRSELADAIREERASGKGIAAFFDGRAGSSEYPTYGATARRLISEKERLSAFGRAYAIICRLKEKGWADILHEFISEGLDNYADAKGTLMRAYTLSRAAEFAKKYKLREVGDFDRAEHEALLRRYAAADKEMLASAPRRLYALLEERLASSAGARKLSSTELPKLASKIGYSVKQTVSENWSYITKLKPCFMMSPLDVSEYLEIDKPFDLVIFDEASQIFTEDALATIVRGRQVIVAGDSKQLPPCDFFRAGEAALDDGENYYDEESNAENSFLIAADKAMSESSVRLSWHYRSCDEALIAFSNEHMNYNLISFPSAVKNPDDGIKYVNVPYSPSTCYSAGKGGSHVNAGEADKAVELIWQEINHPERRRFSIGVVAFSNAQAQEIEKRWELFKQRADRKQIVEEWEREHQNEPIAFCNLDTVQGDERDTVILGICYSQDANGRFKLPYLGRLRLESGKKRINVAITRARHQMIVVSTLTYGLLKTTVDASSAPEENKTGARMLCDFLKYAEAFRYENGAVSAESGDSFVHSVCRVLDENGIKYDTEVGRSACKISIAVRDAENPENYVLGIIIDDPRRTDFDSPREYSRLTEDVLVNKYNWNIYRIYPIAWIEDYGNERSRLLNAVRAARR